MIKRKNSNLVGVIGGTQFDTELGTNFLKKRSIEAISFYISRSPEEQTLLQLSKKVVTFRVENAIKNLLKKDCSRIFIYCNSLSGVINLDYLRKSFDIPIITPIETYGFISERHNLIGLIAANCQSLGNIEKVILKNNSNAIVIGFSSLLIVKAIENGLTPTEVITKFNIIGLCEDLKNQGAEAIVFGCTHFTYLLKEFSQLLTQLRIEIPIIDPSEKMFELLSSAIPKKNGRRFYI